jgi:NAD(P)-dependent dehydrogenase (short-subunit alcohol dehydrogenase family)
MTKLKGRRILITGATSRLGLAMAQALAGAGARVAVVELDVRDESSVRACAERTFDRLGGIDMLVNNAGIGMRTVNSRLLSEPQPFWRVSLDGFREVLDTKATGVFLMARAVVPRMLEAGGGRVINITRNKQTMTRRESSRTVRPAPPSRRSPA